MTIMQNKIITYNDLITSALKRIKTLCKNIDTLPNDLPSAFKNGNVLQVASKYFPLVMRPEHHNPKVDRAAHTSILRATVSDTMLKAVPSSTVERDFLSFIKSRNIYTRTNELVSFKTMMVFYNNLAAFLSARMIYLTSQLDTKYYLFYKPGTVTYPSVNFYAVNIDFTPTQINTCVTDLMNAINNTIHNHLVNIVFQYTSSSCSSSSSSSCSSSSSSSSSSSVFIVYMDI